MELTVANRFENSSTTAFEFSWNIISAQTILEDLTDFLRSPVFYVKCFSEVTAWRLVLHKKDENASIISYHFERIDYTEVLYSIHVSYTLYQVADINRQANVSDELCIHLSAPASPTKTLPFLPDSNGALCILCKMLFAVDASQFLQVLYDPSLLSLVNDIKRMFDDQSFCDVTLKCGDYEQKVHKCIFGVRLKFFCENISNEFEIPLSPIAFRTLIDFVYPLSPLEVPFCIHSELATFAQSNGLLWLQRKMLRTPRKGLFNTNIGEEFLKCDYDLTIVKSWIFGPHLRVLRVTNLKVPELLVHFKKSRMENGEHYLQISLQFNGPLGNDRLGVGLDLAFYDCKGDQTGPRIDKMSFVFVDTEKIDVDPVVTQSLFDGGPLEPCNLRLAFLLQKVKSSTKIQTCHRISMSEVLHNDVIGFRDDMLHLLSEGTFSDILVECRGQTVPLHKVVLSARCPYFKKLLVEDPATEKITIDEFPPCVLMSVMMYIYTGAATFCSVYEEARLISEASRFLELPSLGKMYEKLLACNI